MRISIFGALRASPPAPEATAAAPGAPTLAYRLRQWPAGLPAPFYTADVLRVLSMMSIRPVSREWLQRHVKLQPRALDQLLDLLVQRGELDVVDTSTFAPG